MVRLKDPKRDWTLQEAVFQFLMVRLKEIRAYCYNKTLEHFNSLWFD